MAKQMIDWVGIPEECYVIEYDVLSDNEISKEIEGKCEVDGVWETFGLSINSEYATFSCITIGVLVMYKRQEGVWINYAEKYGN